MQGPCPWPSPPSSLPEPTGLSVCRCPPTAADASRLWRRRSGRTTSNAPGESAPSLSLIPCTCSRGARHSWSRLKVDIGDVPDALGDGPSLKQRCFEDINECINASTEKRKRVLVHCRDGYSLAPTCIIQYLMVKQNMRLIAAYELLRAKYPVNIRECHQNVLVSLERALRPGGNIDPECFKQAISRKVAWT
uniref:protein-tyrosine-phosphatase n=2 Tax=Haplochromini TaxID=319058 RepID=A0A3B4GU65_9CICH